jgi:hypothetical protein
VRNRFSLSTKVAAMVAIALAALGLTLQITASRASIAEVLRIA